MAGEINIQEIKHAAEELARYVRFYFPPTSMYYAASPPEKAILPPSGSWTCIFSMLRRVQDGVAAAFSAKRPGCFGALGYFGFRELPPVAAAMYLSGKERLKKDAGLATSFYKQINAIPAPKPYLVLQRIDLLPENVEADVINLWLKPSSLSVMHTLANYDRSDNDNVIMPFSSGCQSIFTLPYKEGRNGHPRAVVGSLDPTVRRYLDDDIISFSLPARRFVEMCENIPGSFLSL